MKNRLVEIFIILIMIIPFSFPAQVSALLQDELKIMAKETDPEKISAMKDRIINEYHLIPGKDSEAIDILNGNLALAFLKVKQYKKFEEFVDHIKNKFNQTSYLNMAVPILLYNGDTEYAGKIAALTIDKYHSYMNSPSARPDHFPKEDWDRFMKFAQYPYYDAYVAALFALKDYDMALKYQKMSFEAAPEEGMISSIERYAKLLELTGSRDEAENVLLKKAVLGGLTKEMIARLKSLYTVKYNNDKGFADYLPKILSSSKDKLKNELNSKMLKSPAPDFVLKDLKGKEVRLSDFRNKTVVIDLWATWCTPCIASFPAMQKVMKKHPDVEFLFIVVREKGNVKEKVEKLINKNNYTTFNILLDEPDGNAPNGKIISSYRPAGIPVKYFIDKNGILRFVTGGFENDIALLQEIDVIISLMETL